MSWFATFAILAVLLVVLRAVPASPPAKFLAAPFLVPAWLGVVGVVEQLTTDKADCYDACGYTWVYFAALVTLVLAVVVAAVTALGLSIARRRRAPTA